MTRASLAPHPLGGWSSLADVSITFAEGPEPDLSRTALRSAALCAYGEPSAKTAVSAIPHPAGPVPHVLHRPVRECAVCERGARALQSTTSRGSRIMRDMLRVPCGARCAVSMRPRPRVKPQAPEGPKETPACKPETVPTKAECTKPTAGISQKSRRIVLRSGASVDLSIVGIS